MRSTTRVLLVEDEGILAMLTRRELIALGYDVPAPVATGEDAVEAAMRLAPDVVLMDVQLRGEMDGIEAARTIHERRDIPIIYLTAFSEGERVERAQATDPYGYLVKPVDARELHAAIETAIARHRSHLKLRNSEARFRAIAESSPVPLVITRLADSTILWMNDLAADRFGVPSEHLLGRSLGDFFTDPGALDTLVAELLTRGRARNYELALRRPDGSAAVSIASTALGDYQGESVAYTGLVSIDDRRRAESELRERDARTRLALDAAGLGTWRFDFDTALMTFDPIAQAHVGFAHPTVTLAELSDRTHPDDRAPLEDAMRSGAGAMTTFGVRRAFETRVVLSNGEVRWLAIYGLPQDAGAEGGPPTAVIGTTQDITARKRADDTLRRFLAGSPAVVYAMRAGPSGYTASWVSENLETMTGWTPAEGLADGWWFDNLHPDDRAKATQAQRDLGHGPSVLEFRFRKKDGGWIWIRDARRPLAPVDDGMPEVVGSWSDVTDRVALEDRLLQSQKMEAIGRLAGGVAHDFNNLLTVIAGNADLLANEIGAEAQAQGLLREIQDAGARASALTKQLLAFSRSQVLTPKVLDVGEVLIGLEPMLRRLIGEDIVVSTQLSAGVGRVRVDPAQLEQVVLNLAVNARDAMPNGGSLTLAVEAAHVDAAFADRHQGARPGPHVRIVVADTGLGMSPEVLAHAFEPFFTTKGPGKGTGLGLATVFGIVKQSEGLIEVSSQEGVGTRFDIYLPMVADPVGPTTVRPVHTGVSRGHETILLTEDEAAVRRVTAAVLTKQGFNVLVAESGARALQIADQHEGAIDLLVTDMVMPGMPGMELARALRAGRPDLRVLLVSGYIDDALVRSGGLDPSVSYLAKPFSLTALGRKVRSILDDEE